MTNKTNEIIVVLYAGDLAMLYFQALSFAKFWKGDKCITYVIEDNRTLVKDYLEKYILPVLIEFKIKILFAPTEIMPMDGWHKQQILKLWAASVSDRDYSVILDVKNILIRDYSFDENFIDGKLYVQLYHDDYISDQDSESHKKCCRILGKDYNSITKIYCVTPFFWDNNIVRDLLDYFKLHNVNFFNDYFLKNAYESTYYWVFAQDKVPNTPCYHPVQIGQYGGTNKELTISNEEFNKLLKESKDENYPIFTAHRNHFTVANLKSLLSFLRSIGLVANSNDYIDNEYEFLKYSVKKSIPYLRESVRNYMEPRWDKVITPIEINNKKFEVNRLVFYGCSFTAGDELADHEFLEHLSEKEVDDIKRNVGVTDFYLKILNYENRDKTFFDKKKKIEHHYSWAGKLSRKLQLPYINRAVSGNSCQGIIYDIEKDYHNNLIFETDLVIIGLTSESRWFYFDHEGKVKNPISGFEFAWPNSNSYRVFIENFFTDNLIFYNYINSIKYMASLNKQYGINILIQPMHWDIDRLIQYYKEKNISSDNLNMAKNIKNLDCWLDPYLSFGSIVDWNNHNDVLGFSHPKREKHDQLANLLFKKFKIHE